MPEHVSGRSMLADCQSMVNGHPRQNDAVAALAASGGLAAIADGGAEFLAAG